MISLFNIPKLNHSNIMMDIQRGEINEENIDVRKREKNGSNSTLFQAASLLLDTNIPDESTFNSQFIK
jgi:hypothetical protein